MYLEKTPHFTPSEKDKKWYLVDATDAVLGRLASKVAHILRGKHSVKFARNADHGDFIVIVNCEKIKLTGNKLDKKVYNWHTNHIGGIKARTAKEQLEKHPELLLYQAIKGMLPNTPLGRKQLTKLKVFSGSNHKHEAQSPELLNLN